MAVTDLRSHFYDAAQFECNRASWGFKPAAAFEVAHGLSGVAAYYQFPERTIEGETTRYALFFEHYVVGRYSAAVFACYEDPMSNGHKIVKISDLDPALHTALDEDWGVLTALNPELSQVRVDRDDPLNMFDALLGAACLFNVDDLDFFLTNRQAQKSMAIYSYVSTMPDYQLLYDDVCDLAKCSGPGWVPAPQTLRKIKAGLTP